MKKNKNNEELQSRREFFKRAAKGALPILCAIVLANVSGVVNASESLGSRSGCKSCVGTCTVHCGGSCYDKCTGGCKVTCGGSCYDKCTGGCKVTCGGTCKTWCTGSSK